MVDAKRVSLVIAIVCTLLLSNTIAALAQSTEGGRTVYLPLVTTEGDTITLDAPPAGELIPGQYIVVLRDDLVGSASVAATAADLAATYGGELLHTYDAALNGFAIKFAEERSAAGVAGLSQDERVELVEQDMTVSLAEEEVVEATQTNAPWGLDRSDQRNLPRNSTFVYNRTGAGVRVYIIDTGIRISHTQFGTRARDGYDAVDGSLPAADCNGHGTHVAGTVGGSTYGVAKGATLYAVRVLNCSGSGSNSGVIAGVNWVTNQKRANPSIPMVANMSLGGSASSALDAAVQSSINAGVTYAIAAGNSNANACNYSPARVGAALTVGATTSTDYRASYSNYGTCLDLFAPGSSIQSAWYTSNTATATLSGTSMATPHVAGVAALYLQSNPSASPTTVVSALINNSTANVVLSRGTGSPNRLLFTNY
ncbi:MAG: S8 family peptidase [Caldilinea sp. CFX5]|nr:S8 family peptidase [Caldilinea sp. CFX5]